MSTNLELQRLLSGYCEGDLSREEFLRLEDLLGESAENRRIYLEYMDLHGGLIFRSRLAPIVSPSIECSTMAAAQTPLEFVEKAVPASLSEAEPEMAGRVPGRLAYRYFLVAIATLTLTVLIQVFWWRPTAEEEPVAVKPPMPPAPVEAPVSFATLRGADGCVLEGPNATLDVGARLMAGEFRVPKGICNLHFDGGAELVVEGPAVLRLESSSAATVLAGRVVLRADESAAPFDLHTPTSVLVESGTELAVTVSKEGDEVHVFQGEVQRKPKPVGKGVIPQHLKAGEAWRFDPKANFTGKPTKCDPTRFVRHVNHSHPLANDPNAGLIAYEGFDYKHSSSMTFGKANGGKGWIGPWKAGFTRFFPESDQTRFPLHPRDSLWRPDMAVPSVGGCFQFAGYAQYWRRMARPVRLDTNANYYVSFLFRRSGPPSDPINSVGVQFWTIEDMQTQNYEDARKRLFIGVKRANQITTRLLQMETRSAIGLNDNATHLLVAKIAARRLAPNRIFIRVYSPDEKVDASEPTRWSLATEPFDGDLIFDWLQLHINSKTRQTLDEVRVGMTWSSVASAYFKKN